jgi:hypothetical protein
MTSVISPVADASGTSRRAAAVLTSAVGTPLERVIHSSGGRRDGCYGLGGVEDQHEARRTGPARSEVGRVRGAAPFARQEAQDGNAAADGGGVAQVLHYDDPTREPRRAGPHDAEVRSIDEPLAFASTDRELDPAGDHVGGDERPPHDKVVARERVQSGPAELGRDVGGGRVQPTGRRPAAEKRVVRQRLDVMRDARGRDAFDSAVLRAGVLGHERRPPGTGGEQDHDSGGAIQTSHDRSSFSQARNATS